MSVRNESFDARQRLSVPQVRGLTRLVQVVEFWLERRRQRRMLAQLSEHLLKDIGISRSDAQQEAAKPFWRA